MARPISAIDCETNPFAIGKIVKPFIWGVYDERGFCHFKTFDLLLEYLLKDDEKRIIYAHNGGRFDFLFDDVVKHIPNGHSPKIIHGRLTQFRIGPLEFRDSYAAVPIPLAAYKKGEMAYWKLKPQHRAKYRREIIEYLKLDVLALYELMDARNRNYGPALTLAGASLKQAAKIEDFDIPKSTWGYFSALKPYYYGGRSQSLADGHVKGPIKVWDINSAYPYAMGFDHPWGAQYHLSMMNFPRKIPNQSFVEIEAPAVGAFPEGTIKFGTKFPDDGEIKIFRVSGWEYNAALELKLLKRSQIKMISLYSFYQTKNFKKYVDHFYEIRRQAPDGSPEKIFGKLFMNSLYGRFGMAGNEYHQYLIDDIKNIETLSRDGWNIRDELAGDKGIYSRPEPREKWRFHDVATAASVTGFSRAYLLRAMVAARRAGSKILYMDTDSLHIKGAWKPNATGDALGAWKLEDTALEGFYAGKKLYALRVYARKKDGAIKTRNGVKLTSWKKAHKGAILSGEDIQKIATEPDYTFKYEREAPSMGILTGTNFVTREIRNTNNPKSGQNKSRKAKITIDRKAKKA